MIFFIPYYSFTIELDLKSYQKYEKNRLDHVNMSTSSKVMWFWSWKIFNFQENTFLQKWVKLLVEICSEKKFESDFARLNTSLALSSKPKKYFITSTLKKIREMSKRYSHQSMLFISSERIYTFNPLRPRRICIRELPGDWSVWEFEKKI